MKSSEKNGLKSKQTQIKSVVVDFGKEIITWNQLVLESGRLLNGVSKSLKTMNGISRGIHKIEWNKIDIKVGEIQTSLVGSLLSDIELLCVQIHQFMSSLRDITMAMDLTSNKAIQYAIDENPQVFGITSSVTSTNGIEGYPSPSGGGGDNNSNGSISILPFTCEHLLEIQSLAAQYSIEYDRKRQLIDKFFFITSSSSSSSSTITSLNKDENIYFQLEVVENVLQSWADDSSYSLINIEQVNRFLSMNNIK